MPITWTRPAALLVLSPTSRIYWQFAGEATVPPIRTFTIREFIVGILQSRMECTLFPWSGLHNCHHHGRPYFQIGHIAFSNLTCVDKFCHPRLLGCAFDRATAKRGDQLLVPRIVLTIRVRSAHVQAYIVLLKQRRPSV